MGRIPAAIEEWEQVVRIDPAHAEAHNNLTNALAQARQFDEAIAHYEEVLRLQPDDADVRGGLEIARRARLK